MKDNEVGRIAIKLIFAIILIIIFFTGGTLVVKKLWKDNNEKDIKTDLLYIQSKCKIIYDKHIINKEEPLIGEKINQYIENEKINEIINESDKEWYKLKQEDLNKIGEGHLKEEDGYIVNYETEEIIYATGIKKKDKIVYKLSEIISEEKETEENEEESIIEEENNEEGETETIENIDNNEE